MSCKGSLSFLLRAGRATSSAEETKLSALCAGGDKMDTAYLSALAALMGTAVGGLTSFFSTWLGQSAQLKAQLFLHDKGRRQDLYRDFVDEASRLWIDALTNDRPDLSKMIALYALISRMRIVSSSKVIEEAENVGRRIVETYSQPNKTFRELQDMAHEMALEHSLDPLRGFSESCREELEGLAQLWPRKSRKNHITQGVLTQPGSR
jgi:hypothetical protein